MEVDPQIKIQEEEDAGTAKVLEATEESRKIVVVMSLSEQDEGSAKVPETAEEIPKIAETWLSDTMEQT